MKTHQEVFKILSQAGIANEKMLEGAADLWLEIGAQLMQERMTAQQPQSPDDGKEKEPENE